MLSTLWKIVWIFKELEVQVPFTKTSVSTSIAGSDVEFFSFTFIINISLLFLSHIHGHEFHSMFYNIDPISEARQYQLTSLEHQIRYSYPWENCGFIKSVVRASPKYYLQSNKSIAIIQFFAKDFEHWYTLVWLTYLFPNSSQHTLSWQYNLS